MLFLPAYLHNFRGNRLIDSQNIYSQRNVGIENSDGSVISAGMKAFAVHIKGKSVAVSQKILIPDHFLFEGKKIPLFFDVQF